MYPVILTAIGVGGATLFGSVIGFAFKRLSHKFSDIILSFAAGVMLAAAVLGLILPSVEYGGKYGVFVTVIAVFVGALCLNLIDKLVPHLHGFVKPDGESHRNEGLDKVLLFVLAIAIHNLPEGIAAGVGFGSGDTSQALLIAGGIALQNIPEGMVIIAPLLVAGVSVMRTFFIALSIGLLEVVGVWMGFALGTVSAAMLPVMLGFAGGAMLYVTSDEMIPETHAHGYQKQATYALLLGFMTLLLLERI